MFEAFTTAVRLFHPILLEDLWECRRILARHGSLRPRDAIHVAVMRRTEGSVMRVSRRACP